MLNQDTFTLVDPLNGNLAFKLFSFTGNSHFDRIQRLNYFSVIWIQQGSGKAKVDFSEYQFDKDDMFFFTPYQPFMLEGTKDLEGIVLDFHPNFFCIHKHHQEIACNGVLFNNIYNPPFVKVDEIARQTFDVVLAQMKLEFQRPALAQYEQLVAYLKIFLITASRLKVAQQPEAQRDYADRKEPFILQNLKDFIEQHFKTKHSASDYADMLNITPKALAKISKTHFNKTITDLISERIVIEAKRELYLTNKSVKEIAHDLGYDDEYYFSRFFKNNADVSPQMYRETVGFARG
jgi:YesN/AraC family two-component response regulator